MFKIITVQVQKRQGFFADEELLRIACDSMPLAGLKWVIYGHFEVQPRNGRLHTHIGVETKGGEPDSLDWYKEMMKTMGVGVAVTKCHIYTVRENIEGYVLKKPLNPEQLQTEYVRHDYKSRSRIIKEE